MFCYIYVFMSFYDIFLAFRYFDKLIVAID